MLFESVEIEGGALRFRPAPALRGAVKTDLVLDYGKSVDLSQVPTPVLWAPGIYNMAPIVWLLGLTATVPFRCAPLEEGLRQIHATFVKFYPSERWDGRLVFEGSEVVVTEPMPRAIAMFSGGLDAIQTVLRHLDERPALVTLTPATMAPEVRAATLGRAAEFADQYGLEHLTLTSNISLVVDVDRLLFADLVRHRLTWWQGVQHGMGISSAAAPLAYLKRAGRVYLASSYSEEHPVEPWGSTPSIDNHVAWPGTRVIHDSYDLSRQDKIRALIKYTQGAAKPRLRVCNRTLDGLLNCGTCEKCLRTMIGLVVEGEDPKDWGLNADPRTAIERAKRAFESKRLTILDDQVFMWNDIRRGAEASKVCPPDLARWLAGLDLRPHYRRSRRERWVRAMAHKFAPTAVKSVLVRAVRAKRLKEHREAAS
jgi:hypothetical protein